MSVRHKSYGAVQKPVLYFGVTPEALRLEIVAGVMIWGLAKIELGGGNGWMFAAAAVFLLHCFFGWAFRKDPRIKEKFFRYLNEPDELHPGANRRLPPGFGGIL